MQTMTLTQTCVMAILQAIAVVIFIFIVVPLTTFAERKVLGYLQDRLGATRIAGSRNGLTGALNRLGAEYALAERFASGAISATYPLYFLSG